MRTVPPKADQRVDMKIHEYQAKEILRKFGVPTPRGVACFSVDEAVKAFVSNFEPWGGAAGMYMKLSAFDALGGPQAALLDRNTSTADPSRIGSTRGGPTMADVSKFLDKAYEQMSFAELAKAEKVGL